MTQQLISLLPACTACMGEADSAQTQGTNAAILYLLCVVFCVLGGVSVVGLRIYWNEQTQDDAALLLPRPRFGGEGWGEGASASSSVTKLPLTLTLSPEAGARGQEAQPVNGGGEC